MTKARETASLVSSKTGIAVTISGDPVSLGIGNTDILTVFANKSIGINTTLAEVEFDFRADDDSINMSVHNTRTSSGARSSLVFYTKGDGHTRPRAKFTTSDDESDKGYLSVLTRDGGSKERLRIRGTGDIGIGKTDPQQKVDILGNLAVDGDVGIGNSTPSSRVHALSGASDNPHFYFKSTESGATNNSGDLFKIEHSRGTGNTNALLNVLNSSGSVLYVRGTGDIGIGKTDPQQKVDILGNLGVDGDVGIGTSAVKSGAFSIYDKDIELEGTTAAAPNFTIINHRSSSTQGIHFKNDSGSYQMGIRGAGTSRTNPGAAQGMPQIFTYNTFDLYIGTDGSDSIFFTSGRTDRMEIRSDGGVVMNNVYSDAISSGRDLYISSGGRLGYISSIGIAKTNVSSLTNIDWIDQLRIVNFNYKKFTETTTGIGSTEQTIINYLDTHEEETEYGLIAEEVVGINTDLVFYNENSEGSKSLAGVHYRKLIPVLIKGLQDARSEINILKTRLDQAGITT